MPVIALVDTNCDPDEADFVIPGNDDAIRSCSLIVHALGDAIAEGKQRARPADFAPAPAEETQPEPEPEPAAEAAPEPEAAPQPEAEAAPAPEPVAVPDTPDEPA
jgi:small subunit ribosomal protein S2